MVLIIFVKLYMKISIGLIFSLGALNNTFLGTFFLYCIGVILIDMYEVIIESYRTLDSEK